MDICFEGVGQVAATFQVDGEELKAGMAVTLTGSGTVGLGSDGDMPCGVVLSGVRHSAAAVQIGGVAKVTYVGEAPAVGWQKLVCDGEGGVKAVADTAVMTLDEGDEESDGENGAESGTGTAADTAADTAGDGLKFLVLAVNEDEKSVVVKL